MLCHPSGIPINFSPDSMIEREAMNTFTKLNQIWIEKGAGKAGWRDVSIMDQPEKRERCGPKMSKYDSSIFDLSPLPRVRAPPSSRCSSSKGGRSPTLEVHVVPLRWVGRPRAFEPAGNRVGADPGPTIARPRVAGILVGRQACPCWACTPGATSSSRRSSPRHLPASRPACRPNWSRGDRISSLPSVA